MNKYSKRTRLLPTVRRRSEHHKFSTDRRDVSAIKNEVIDSLVEYLSQRFAIDTERLSILKTFATLQENANIKAVHELLCCDLELQPLGMEYDELMNMENVCSVRKLLLKKVVSLLASS